MFKNEVMKLAHALKEKSLYRVIGVMSGTSMDGIDLALIETDGAFHIRPLAFGQDHYSVETRAALFDLIRSLSLSSHAVPPEVQYKVTDEHCRAVASFMAKNHLEGETIDLVGFHGQTVFHAPRHGVTIQLFDGQRAAKLLSKPVVSDFRSADVKAGGEGAPLAPLYHHARLGEQKKPLAILNVGGVGNVSFCAPDQLLAFDTGPGSALLDDFMRQRLGTDYDRDGDLARRGRADHALIEQALAHPYFMRPPPKSLDRNMFHDFLEKVMTLSDADGAATLTSFTSRTVAAACRHFHEPVSHWYICGGGRHNRFLMQVLAEDLKADIHPVEALGWNGDMLEAECFAWLAVRSLKSLPLSLPTTTGVRRPMTGGRIDYPDL